MTIHKPQTFIPFPPRIAVLSADAASASLKANKDRPRNTTPSVQERRNVAAFRMPDGRLLSAHDLYSPQYPVGAEPGLASVRYSPSYSVNGYEGYDAQVLSFVPAREFLRPDTAPDAVARRTDTLAVALIEHEGRSAIAWALDEKQMAGWTENLPDGARARRLPITLHGMEGGEAPACALMFTAPGATECHVASSRSALFLGLAERRLGFLKLKGAGAEEAEAKILDHAGKHGWGLVAQIDTPIPDHPVFRGPAHAINALNTPVLALLGLEGTPERVLLPETDKIRVAVISADTGAPPILVYGFDAQSSVRRATMVLAELTGDDSACNALADPFLDPQPLFDRILDDNPALTVGFCSGNAHVSPGAFPKHLLTCVDMFTGRAEAIGAASESSLVTLAKMQLFNARSDTVDVDDADEIAGALSREDNGWIYPVVNSMASEEYDHRLAMMRHSLSQTPEPDTGM